MYSHTATSYPFILEIYLRLLMRFLLLVLFDRYRVYILIHKSLISRGIKIRNLQIVQ